MGRRTKPPKTKVQRKRPGARRLRKTDDGRIRELEKRLEGALKDKGEALGGLVGPCQSRNTVNFWPRP